MEGVLAEAKLMDGPFTAVTAIFVPPVSGHPGLVAQSPTAYYASAYKRYLTHQALYISELCNNFWPNVSQLSGLLGMHRQG